jgi:hypothetical protein
MAKEGMMFTDYYPELRGLAASVGIVKGKPFVPDDRLKKSSPMPSP